MSERQNQEVAYGCIFCRSGGERIIADRLKTLNPDIDVIVPTKLRYHRGKQKDEQVILFPGYVFVRADTDYPMFSRVKHEFVYKILCDKGKDWRLYDSDAEIVQKLFEMNGVIGYSKAYYENDRIRIVEGFLKSFEGSITRVNHRMHTAEVTISICKRETRIWVGFEEIEAQ